MRRRNPFYYGIVYVQPPQQLPSSPCTGFSSSNPVLLIADCRVGKFVCAELYVTLIFSSSKDTATSETPSMLDSACSSCCTLSSPCKPINCMVSVFCLFLRNTFSSMASSYSSL